MKDRTLDFIIAGLLFLCLLGTFLLGCRALNRNPELWLCVALLLFPMTATANLHSPRGAEVYGWKPAAGVSLAWDASPSPDVAGYRVYYRKIGQPSYSTSQRIDVGPNLTARVTGLERKTTYSFVCTAYAAGGLESEFSEELIYRTPFSPSDR